MNKLLPKIECRTKLVTSNSASQKKTTGQVIKTTGWRPVGDRSKYEDDRSNNKHDRSPDQSKVTRPDGWIKGEEIPYSWEKRRRKLFLNYQEQRIGKNSKNN